jgi:LacI family repressor for deo operon, udp, cdd, tsx, nupC, and nupG
MSKMLASGGLPTAMVVVNDFAALGALEALRLSGLSVPEDISLVGFDDLRQGGLALTTVRVDLIEVGRSAARLLFSSSMDSSDRKGEIIFPVELIIRNSTAAPTNRNPSKA